MTTTATEIMGAIATAERRRRECCRAFTSTSAFKYLDEAMRHGDAVNILRLQLAQVDPAALQALDERGQR
jgi:hypothetical protein